MCVVLRQLASAHLLRNRLLIVAVPSVAPTAGLGEVHRVKGLPIKVADGLELELCARCMDARVAPPEVQQLEALHTHAPEACCPAYSV